VLPAVELAGLGARLAVEPPAVELPAVNRPAVVLARVEVAGVVVPAVDRPLVLLAVVSRGTVAPRPARRRAARGRVPPY
jgi:hypothetical protein